MHPFVVRGALLISCRCQPAAATLLDDMCQLGDNHGEIPGTFDAARATGLRVDVLDRTRAIGVVAAELDEDQRQLLGGVGQACVIEVEDAQ